MNSYFKLINASAISCIETRNNLSNNKLRVKTASPPKVRNMTPSSKPKVKKDKANEIEKETVNAKNVDVKKEYSVEQTKPLRPKRVWVPKKT